MSENTEPNIEIRENAFIRVAELPKLTGPDGQDMPVKEVMAFCRCGLSQNKPFCDGSHKREGFDGSYPAEPRKEKVLTYEGAEIDVYYSILLCSHAGECGKRLGKVFDSAQRPWIMPDKGSVEDIKDVVRACPSGALRYGLKGEDAQHIVGDAAEIVIEKNGPLRVSNIPLLNVDRSAAASNTGYVLCRCGLSKNKPYCDGTHKDEGWSDGS